MFLQVRKVENFAQQKKKTLFCCSCNIAGGEAVINKKSSVFKGFRVCCSYIIAAEQKARAVYDNILRLSDDPDVNEVIKFLRQREVIHFQRFGEALDNLQSKLRCKPVTGIGIKQQ